MRESGYTELAVAIWQGLLELNFLARPTSENWKEDFRDFWDSETPRIGEDGSQGWLNFHDNTMGTDAVTQSNEQEVLESKDLFKDWAKAERLRVRSARLPAKTSE